ncbi:MAG: AlpA family phage regulatory protein [SAR324 cluster bacterium]|nr:AlpA family phage regulatory protein [SAR324 cluster bacterium]
MNEQIIRCPKLKSLTGLSRTTIWRLERKGVFPKRVQISARAVGWKLSEVQDWIKNQIAV